MHSPHQQAIASTAPHSSTHGWAWPTTSPARGYWQSQSILHAGHMERTRARLRQAATTAACAAGTGAGNARTHAPGPRERKHAQGTSTKPNKLRPQPHSHTTHRPRVHRPCHHHDHNTLHLATPTPRQPCHDPGLRPLRRYPASRPTPHTARHDTGPCSAVRTHPPSARTPPHHSTLQHQPQHTTRHREATTSHSNQRRYHSHRHRPGAHHSPSPRHHDEPTRRQSSTWWYNGQVGWRPSGWTSA